MIQEFATRFVENKQAALEHFSKKHPDNYAEIVQVAIKFCRNPKKDYGTPDPKRIVQIDEWGSYSGTLVFVIGESGYSPGQFWYVLVDYGSCSICDTLQSIERYSRDAPTEEQAKEYWTLALHVVQGLTEMEDRMPGRWDETLAWDDTDPDGRSADVSDPEPESAK